MSPPRDEVAEGLETLLGALDRLSADFEQLADDLAGASAAITGGERITSAEASGLMTEQKQNQSHTKDT